MRTRKIILKDAGEFKKMARAGHGTNKGKLSRSLVSAMICSFPIIAGISVAVFLFCHLGHHCTFDVSAWSSLQQSAKELNHDSNGAVYFRVETYYVIFLCVVVIVCFVNSLSFLLRSLNAISQIERMLKEEALQSVTRDEAPGHKPTKEEIYESDDIAKSDWRVKLGMFAVTLRGFALLLNGVLAAYLAVGFSVKAPIYFDEAAIFIMFLVFMLTDIGLLWAIYGVKKSVTWTEHRELLGTLLYIDVPTIVSVGLIVVFGPSLLSGSSTPESMFRAIAGGGMIVHLVSSQIIQSILLGEEWANERSMRWSSIPS